MKKILVVADPLEAFKIYKDTTFAMMRELQRRGHTLAACEPEHLQWQSGQQGSEFTGCDRHNTWHRVWRRLARCRLQRLRFGRFEEYLRAVTRRHKRIPLHPIDPRLFKCTVHCHFTEQLQFTTHKDLIQINHNRWCVRIGIDIFESHRIGCLSGSGCSTQCDEMQSIR